MYPKLVLGDHKEDRPNRREKSGRRRDSDPPHRSNPRSQRAIIAAGDCLRARDTIAMHRPASYVKVDLVSREDGENRKQQRSVGMGYKFLILRQNFNFKTFR